VIAGAALLLLVLLGARTVARTLDWRSDVAYWSSELEKAPREPVVNNNLAVAWLARRDYTRAVERLQVVLEVHPRYWRAYINLGIALGELGRREAARQAFLQAQALAPESADPPFYFARWLRQVGEPEEALRQLAVAQRLRPEEARLPLLQGEVLLEAGRVEEARPALLRAAALDPKDGRAGALLEGTRTAPARPLQPGPP
jgi:Flp pilus assembly protein TadD